MPFITLSLRPGREDSLKSAAAREAGIPPKSVDSLQIVKRSVDARDRDKVRLVYSVLVNEPETPPAPPPLEKTEFHGKTVVVGLGPAGLFCAYALALAGAPPLILERGGDIDARVAAVEDFRRTGRLDPECNIQFGEGGAGAFSDGKLNTGTKSGFSRFILEALVKFGAPREILFEAKPHAGTDRLRAAVKNMRLELERLGCEVRFNTKVTDFSIENGVLRGLASEKEFIPCDRAVLAVGHSARDTFEALYKRGVPMEKKTFSAGVRVEQLQSEMDKANYGKFAGHPSLPASSYKLSAKSGERGVYTFCVCPGGEVVAAASEAGGVVTNGMSQFSRDGVNINGALLVNVYPSDLGEHPLSGMYFQRELERAAFALGGGDYRAPAQLAGDFLQNKASAGPGTVLPSCLPGVRWTNLRDILPPFITDGIAKGLNDFTRKIPCYGAFDAVLTGVETRSSSPVRIPRGENGCPEARGLYPCGEGAGWAGGIMSAAADGVACALSVAGRE